MTKTALAASAESVPKRNESESSPTRCRKTTLVRTRSTGGKNGKTHEVVHARGVGDEVVGVPGALARALQRGDISQHSCVRKRRKNERERLTNSSGPTIPVLFCGEDWLAEKEGEEGMRDEPGTSCKDPKLPA
jgi:hypothetical protein